MAFSKGIHIWHREITKIVAALDGPSTSCPSDPGGHWATHHYDSCVDDSARKFAFISFHETILKVSNENRST